MEKKPRKSKRLCCLCYDHYYNGNTKGGCFYYKKAKVVKKVEVGKFEQPPYNKSRAEWTLSCHTREGYSMISMDDNRLI